MLPVRSQHPHACAVLTVLVDMRFDVTGHFIGRTTGFPHAYRVQLLQYGRYVPTIRSCMRSSPLGRGPKLGLTCDMHICCTKSLWKHLVHVSLCAHGFCVFLFMPGGCASLWSSKVLESQACLTVVKHACTCSASNFASFSSHICQGIIVQVRAFGLFHCAMVLAPVSKNALGVPG